MNKLKEHNKRHGEGSRHTSCKQQSETHKTHMCDGLKACKRLNQRGKDVLLETAVCHAHALNGFCSVRCLANAHKCVVHNSTYAARKTINETRRRGDLAPAPHFTRRRKKKQDSGKRYEQLLSHHNLFLSGVSQALALDRESFRRGTIGRGCGDRTQRFPQPNHPAAKRKMLARAVFIIRCTETMPNTKLGNPLCVA